MKLGSLFAGIGGFDLAARWMGWTTAWYSENDPYASYVMEKQFPGVKNHGDITKIRGSAVERVNMLVGGFPCQDISLIGLGAGIDGEQSGLWKHYRRLIGELRPEYVLAENVAALRTRGLERVLSDLNEVGYDAEWHCIPASSIGAPHQRDRIWIVAYPEGSHTKRVVGDRECQRLEGYARNGGPAEWETPFGPTAPSGLLGRGNAVGWWSSEPRVGRVADGIPSRVDRIKCVGNALVPYIPFVLYGAIAAARAERIRTQEVAA